MIFLNLLVVVLLGVTVWQQYQLNRFTETVDMRLAKQGSELTKVRAIVAPFETMKRAGQIPFQSGKTRSEVQGLRGPVPVSMIVKSDRVDGDPAPGSDVTSGIKRKKVDPCAGPCDRLADCALEPAFCPRMDTRQHDSVANLCRDACAESGRMKEAFATVTECGVGIARARSAIPGFSSLCGGARK